MKKREEDPIVQCGLRIRTSLRDRIQKQADRSDLSLNSEIERRLIVSFDAVADEEFVRMRTEFTNIITALNNEYQAREQKLKDRIRKLEDGLK